MRPHGAFILARYSTDNQNADSIEVQVGKCSEWCNAQSLPILGIYADYAVSGMKDTRPQYEAMMAALREGRADTVVIYDQSRMFRLMTAWFEFRQELSVMGVEVVSVTQPLVGGDLRDPANFMNEGITALFNQMWALQTRQKVVEKMRHMAQTGQHTGGKPPLGYRIEEGRLIPDETEAPIVRRIFAEYAAGRSYKQIIDGLNADGIKTKRGNPFGTNSLHDLLRNEKYIGTLIYGKALHREDGSRNTHATSPDMIRIEDAHAAIIDRDLFQKVQDRLSGNKRDRGGRPATKRDYPLRGKVFCGLCGAPMVINNSSHTYDYYKCGKAKRTHTCDNKPIRVDTLERLAADEVRRVLGQPDLVDTMIATLQREAATLQSGAARRLSVIAEQYKDVSTRLENAVEAVLSGLNSPTIQKRIKELENQKNALDREAKALRQSVDQTAIPADHLRQLLDTIVSTPTLGDAALLAIVARVEVFPTHILVWTHLTPDPNTKPNYHTPGTELPTALMTNDGAPSAPPTVIINAQFLRIMIPR